ncbi:MULTISPECIES: M15 family metallopeptidase [Anaerovoracaceae]
MIHKNDFIYKLFKKHGFTWGGDWKALKDYQHFEK